MPLDTCPGCGKSVELGGSLFYSECGKVYYVPEGVYAGFLEIPVPSDQLDLSGLEGKYPAKLIDISLDRGIYIREDRWTREFKFEKLEDELNNLCKSGDMTPETRNLVLEIYLGACNLQAEKNRQ